MKDGIKRVVNGLLRPLDLEVRRREPLRVAPEYHLALIEETLHLYAELGFVDLVPTRERLDLLARLTGTRVGEAVHILKYLGLSLDVPGDVCEFGTGAGATSALLAHELTATGKDLWLFDSFQGLPAPTEKDELLHDIHGVGTLEQYEGRMRFSAAEVRSRISATEMPLERVHIVPGFIEETIKSAQLPAQVAFAYVDFDFYEPIRIALEYLDRTMPVGGHILVDDYGWFSAGAQRAVDEFIAANQDRYAVIHPYLFAGYFITLHRQ